MKGCLWWCIRWRQWQHVFVQVMSRRWAEPTGVASQSAECAQSALKCPECSVHFRARMTRGHTQAGRRERESSMQYPTSVDHRDDMDSTGTQRKSCPDQAEKKGKTCRTQQNGMPCDCEVAPHGAFHGRCFDDESSGCVKRPSASRSFSLLSIPPSGGSSGGSLRRSSVSLFHERRRRSRRVQHGIPFRLLGSCT